MLESIKKGFGLTVGAIFGYGVLSVLAEGVLKHYANNEEYMEQQKNKNPEIYEILKKYQKKDEED